MPLALFVLQELHARGYKLYLVSRKENNRAELVKQLGIDKYFSDVTFLPEKTQEALKDFTEKNAISPNESFVVGDRTCEEIAIGNLLGIRTIWFQNGKFANELPQSKKEDPTFRVTNLKEILNIVP